MASTSVPSFGGPTEPSELADPCPSAFSDESHKKNPVTGVIGVQVDARVSTVEWTSGQRTVLPFLPK